MIELPGARYLSGLRAYLAGGGETALSEGYEIGRKSLVGGLGVLEIAAMHHEALRAAVLPATPTERERLASLAEEFFAEALSPFEMAARGYREANEQLLHLNRELMEKSHTLELANRELESFAYSASHDLRAPLRTISGFAGVLLEDHGEALDEEGRRLLQRMSHAAKQMAMLIDGLLELSRASRAELVRDTFDLTACALQVAEELRAAEPARNVEFDIEEGLVMHADQRLFGSVVRNLLGNAWKFTAKNEHARIEIARHGAGSTFRVRDNGAGFDPASSNRLFGAFQRLHSSTEFEGTGVGLATVQRIVQRHGGSVWAEGQVGVGASFYVSLPEPT